MSVPWSGFPMAKLVELARPLSSAKYVRMETFMDPSIAPGQRQRWHPWPYIEGLTIAEATNELAFMVTGAYGKPVPSRWARRSGWRRRGNTASSRSSRSCASPSPTSGRRSFWEALQASEYGFWANVNPQVAHPRWSQATEEIIGTNERKPTLLFNGYGEYVADMYKGLEKERLWA